MRQVCLEQDADTPVAPRTVCGMEDTIGNPFGILSSDRRASLSGRELAGVAPSHSPEISAACKLGL